MEVFHKGVCFLTDAQEGEVNETRVRLNRVMESLHL